MGRILLIEFNETDSNAFNEVIEMLNKHRTFEKVQINMKLLCLYSGLEICPKQRKSTAIARKYTSRQSI